MHTENGQTSEKTQQNIEICRDLLEKIQLNLPLGSKKMHKNYLVGYIDCLHDQEIITEEMRDELYLDYL